MLKLALAAWLPVTGDEAYFYLWARHLDYGYYDHPPLIAWLLWPLQGIAPWTPLLRLPAVLVSLAVALGMYGMLRAHGEVRARAAALLFALVPVYLLVPVPTTDTPLLLFAFASVWALQRALATAGAGWYALAGVLLGLAFLSKYFAVLLGAAYLVLYAARVREALHWRGFALLAACALALVAVNVLWNYEHCWDNILFNLYNRNVDEQASLVKPLLFVVVQLYLATPVVVYYLARRGRELASALCEPANAVLGFAFAVPLALLGLVSVSKEVGLHWVLAFYPFLFLLAGRTLAMEQLRAGVLFMAGFSALHLAVMVALLAVPTSAWRGLERYSELVFLLHTEEVAAEIERLAGERVLLSTSYTPSSMLAHRLQRDLPVFGLGSRYARQDDILTDFREFDGRDLVVLIKNADDAAQLSPYFSSIRLSAFELRGARYHLVEGERFRYPVYRERILESVRQRYYRIPAWLPVGGCDFCARYFGDVRCEIR